MRRVLAPEVDIVTLCMLDLWQRNFGNNASVDMAMAQLAQHNSIWVHRPMVEARDALIMVEKEDTMTVGTMNGDMIPEEIDTGIEGTAITIGEIDMTRIAEAGADMILRDQGTGMIPRKEGLA